MRLYQMRDKIIYGTVRQYHIWFILKRQLEEQKRLVYFLKKLKALEGR